MSTHDELRDIALHEFARAGYGSTSLQRIAELAGVSKSNVLYHFASKEVLMEAALGPALDRFESIIHGLESGPFTGASKAVFIEQFVDLLLAHRLEVHMFINQGAALEDVPVIGRANEVIVRIAQFFESELGTVEERMRFAIALGGAAYMLVSEQIAGIEPTPISETRAALLAIISELLLPVSTRAR